jgi:hypothetical protein
MRLKPSRERPFKVFPGNGRRLIAFGGLGPAKAAADHYAGLYNTLVEVWVWRNNHYETVYAAKAPRPPEIR